VLQPPLGDASDAAPERAMPHAMSVRKRMKKSCPLRHFSSVLDARLVSHFGLH
jgi:hypothetical protein